MLEAPRALMSMLVLALAVPAQDRAQYSRHLTLGALTLFRGEPEAAIADFEAALAARPDDSSANLDLAIACLFAGRLDRAITAARAAAADPSARAAARYVEGCVLLRRGELQQGVAALEEARQLTPTIPAVHFQLGWAELQLQRFAEAERHLREVVLLEPQHAAAHYLLSRALVRLGRREQARAELELHRRLTAARPGAGMTSLSRESFEPCRLTEPRFPGEARQPVVPGVEVRFTRADAFADPERYHAPVCAIDAGRDGRIDLFVAEGQDGFRLLRNEGGRFVPSGELLPAAGTYRQALVGDLAHDNVEDVLLLGPDGSRVFGFDTNGRVSDATARTGLAEVGSSHGALVDLDHTGSLDLVITEPDGLRFLRNLGAMRFVDATAEVGLPETLPGARQVAAGDWDGDDLIDLVVARGEQPLALFRNARRRQMERFGAEQTWPAGERALVEDLACDLALDAVVSDGGGIRCRYGDGRQVTVADDAAAGELFLLDYDNDGWLDIGSAGAALRIWRNLGGDGFREVTSDLGLEALALGPIATALAADFDADGDGDLLLALREGGLELLRNDGGNANQAVSLRLAGTRSNGSGLGARIEIYTEDFRTSRTVSRVPLEIGIGRDQAVTVMNVVFLNQTYQLSQIEAVPGRVLEIAEPYTETGSCPFLYAWDGQRFRFVTDVLGASPLGLPLAPDFFTEADTDEYVWLGGEDLFQPLLGRYELRVTEELREVLYLDEVRLAVVDHPAGTEVHANDKLRPAPFPPSELVALHRRVPLQAAADDAGADRTAELAAIDGSQVSPPHPLGPHLRGRCAPYSLTLDFGPLDGERPLVLAMTGWLRYGGGMGNIAAALHPDLPPPLPTLAAETGNGEWTPLELTVGAPAGKTKTILVDLQGALPAGTRRLQLTAAVEIHWDRIALFERAPAAARITELRPDGAELRWHGYGEILPHGPDQPLRNDYHRLRPAPPFRWLPAGDYTRYGDVEELVRTRDDRLALLGGGDEVAVWFDAARLPARPPGTVRDFFFYSVGWDKDADYHNSHGLTVGPLPFHGMDDQRYGEQPRPAHLPTDWIERYNTRRVEAGAPGAHWDSPAQALRAWVLRGARR